MLVENGFIAIFVTLIAMTVGAMIGVYSQQIDKDLMRKKLCKYEIEYCTKEQIIKQIKK